MKPAPLPRWPAPTAPGPVRATVAVPGSKSVTNRALVLAALSDSPGRLRRPLRSRDTELMAAGLRGLGARVTSPDGDDGDWLVTPAAFHGPADVDVGLAGTVMRFLPPVATLADGAVRFDGDPRARERPMDALVAALRSLGADVSPEDAVSLPLTVTGRGGLAGGAVEVDASASSQIVSALLLTGPRWVEGVQITHVGDRPVPNAAHLAMTVGMLRRRGMEVAAESPGRWQVRPGVPRALDEVVEPDLSSAAPFLAAAVVTGGEVTVRDWPAETAQPGAVLPQLLEALGATARWHDGSLVVTGGSRVCGIDVDLRDAGELTPVIAAVAALADSPSRLRGIGYLRGHETDRLAALARELGRLGAGVSEDADGLRIVPRPLAGALFHTYADHRLAMAAAVLGLVVPGVVVEDIDTTAKTFPGFANAWQAMLSGAGS
ncbi:MAG: 3-phosphoshikimate 1-carboxyvinyltransferase [Frankiaceae bacterium]|nr:3-phosphoshikimate 1-carboxyvinyltransferase [Frankiaceae bacterium]